MPNHPRIEATNIANFCTSKTKEHQIWFTCDRKLSNEILANLAQCVNRYNVKLYAVALEGTHKHELAEFPEGNRSSFYRDFNAATTRAIKYRFKIEGPGSIQARPYSNEFVPRDVDIENQFFYTVLQPVQDGLVTSIYEYPGYNCFEDAIHEREREFELLDRTRYNSDKRWKKNINIRDYITPHKLKFERLPGYEHLTQAEYVALMRKKLKQRTKELVKQRKAAGGGYVGAEKLLAQIPGSKAKNPKQTLSRWQFRPRIICGCKETSARYLSWYFAIYKAYRNASAAYRRGEEAEFPIGTYKPPLFTCSYYVRAEDLSLNG